MRPSFSYFFCLIFDISFGDINGCYRFCSFGGDGDGFSTGAMSFISTGVHPRSNANFFAVASRSFDSHVVAGYGYCSLIYSDSEITPS